MYFLYVLASFYLLLKYSRQPLHNGVSNWQWNVLILAKLFEVKNDIPIINDIFNLYNLCQFCNSIVCNISIII